MRPFDFWRVDVFAARPLEGNPLAVFPHPKDLSDAEMLAIAREMNISETTFLQPSGRPEANYRTRIFTPGGELPFAGHPTLGSAYVAAEEGLIVKSDGVVSAHQEDGNGLTPVRLTVEGGVVRRVVMTQGKPKMGRKFTPVAPLAKALGIKPRDILQTEMAPQIASTGINALIVPIRSVEIVREMAPDQQALGKVLRRFGTDPGVYTFAFVDGGPADLHARGFFPLQGVFEDPATGSAAGSCGAFLAANGRLPNKQWFVIEQGSEIHHPSRIEVAVAVERGRPTQVRVAGEVVPVMRGSLTLS